MSKPLIVQVIPNLGVGGAEALLVAFATYPSKDFDYAVIYFKDGINRDALEKAGVPCFYMRAGKHILLPSFWIEFYTLLKRVKPALLHGWLWSACITSRIIGNILGIPVISAYHNNLEQNGTIRNIIDSATFCLDSESIAVSPQVAEPLVKRAKSHPITVIYNGIESEPIFRAAQVIRGHKQKSYYGKYVIGFVGRFVPVKNIPFLLEAFKMLAVGDSSVHLILLGGGPQERLLRSMVDSMGLQHNVTFVVGENAKEWYGHFDLFVQPSFKEGISIALLEALSAEVPSIVLNDTQYHSVITDGKTGRVVTNFTPQALADTMLNIKNNPALIEHFKVAGKQLVQDKFNFILMHSRYENIYKKWVHSSEKSGFR